MKPRTLRLGELLEQRGRLAHEQTLRALRNQKVLGGRLGTCLLEIDAINEDELLHALADLHGVPFAGPEELRGIDAEVIALLPAKVAQRCRAVPFHAGATQVKVAVADARDLTVQSEVSFVVGKRIRWYVTSDLRIHEALQKYYGAEISTRYDKLVDRLNRSRFLWSRDAAEEVEAEAPAPAPSPFDLPPRATPPPLPAPPPPLEAPPPELVASPIVAEAPGDDDTQDVAPIVRPRGPLSIADAEAQLLDPHDRDDVARALVDFAARRARRCVLLVARKQEIAAWMWSGEGLDAPKLAAYRAGLDEPSIFQSLAQGADGFEGVLPPVPAHRALLEALAPDSHGRPFVAIPLRVRSRLVAALVLEPEGEGLGDELRSEFRRIAAKAAIAFELCIMRAKLKKA